MKTIRWLHEGIALAGLTAIVCLAVACGGGGSDGTTVGEDGGGTSTGTVSTEGAQIVGDFLVWTNTQTNPMPLSTKPVSAKGLPSWTKVSTGTWRISFPTPYTLPSTVAGSSVTYKGGSLLIAYYDAFGNLTDDQNTSVKVEVTYESLQVEWTVNGSLKYDVTVTGTASVDRGTPGKTVLTTDIKVDGTTGTGKSFSYTNNGQLTFPQTSLYPEVGSSIQGSLTFESRTYTYSVTYTGNRTVSVTIEEKSTGISVSYSLDLSTGSLSSS